MDEIAGGELTAVRRRRQCRKLGAARTASAADVLLAVAVIASVCCCYTGTVQTVRLRSTDVFDLAPTNEVSPIIVSDWLKSKCSKTTSKPKNSHVFPLYDKFVRLANHRVKIYSQEPGKTYLDFSNKFQ